MDVARVTLRNGTVVLCDVDDIAMRIFRTMHEIKEVEFV